MNIENKERTFPLLLKILILNLPLFSIIISRHLIDIEFSLLTTVYIFSLLLGYYFLVSFIITLPAFVVLFIRKISIFLTLLILTFFLYYLIVDSIVYNIYKFHINLFFLELFIIDFDGFGLTAGMIFLAIGLFLILIIIEFGILKLAKKMRSKYLLLIIPFVLLYIFSQLIHIYAFANDRGDITNLTVRLPLYFPVQSSKIANKHQKLGSNLGLENNPDLVKDNSIKYPKTEFQSKIGKDEDSIPNLVFIVLESWRFDALDSLYCPNMFSFSKRSTVASKHFSSGSVTTSGLFGMFYGLHPTYWEPVIANNTLIDNPVFIDVLEENNYEFGIFANSGFERLKIASTIFNNITIRDEYEGDTEWQKDIDKNNKFIDFLKEQKKSEKPFLGFVFYKSSHHAYQFNEKHNIFKPNKKINLGLVNNDTDPLPFINAYKNSVHFVDELVSGVIDTLEKYEMMDNTIVVITSDHGEEFNDNKENYWGHGSNFTEYQSSVPLIMFLPNKDAQTIKYPTGHIDIVPTILEEGFDLKSVANSYSNGQNIYNLNGNIRPFVVSSYVNHALIIEDNVYAVYPFTLKKYKLNNIKDKIDNTNQSIFRKAVDEMNVFYK